MNIWAGANIITSKIKAMKHNIHPSDELKLLFDNKVKRKVYINGTIDVSVIVRLFCEAIWQ